MSYYLILIAVGITVFAIGQKWFGSRPDPLVARYRFVGTMLRVVALLLLAQIICLFTLPNSSSFNPKHPEAMFIVFVAILYQYLHFSRRLKNRDVCKLK